MCALPTSSDMRVNITTIDIITNQFSHSSDKIKCCEYKNQILHLITYMFMSNKYTILAIPYMGMGGLFGGDFDFAV